MLELDGSNANAFFSRGSTHDSLGAYDKAISDYSRALEIDRAAQQAHLPSAGGGGGGATRERGVPSPGAA